MKFSHTILKHAWAALAAGLAAFGPAFAEPLKITAGYVSATEFLPLFAAAEKGMFAKYDLAVEPKRIPIITNIPQALISGDLQIGATTVPVLLQSNDGGLDLQLVSGAARHLKTSARVALVARSSLKMEKPEDLIGKKIGVAGFNSSMDVFLRKWLKTNGVDEKRLTRIEAIFPQMPDLLKSGTIDAATMTEPFKSAVVKSGAGYIFADYVSETNPDVLMIAYAATAEWARAHPRAVRDFRAALDEAGEWVRANPEQAKAFELKYLGFASAGPNSFTTAMSAGDIAFYAGLGKEFGLYRNPMDPQKMIAD